MRKKNKEIHRKVGRPYGYDSINKIQLKKLALAGWDEAQISDFFGITVTTLTRWKQRNKDFCISLKDWKKEADLKVEKSLYKRAIGYEYDEVTYEKSKIGGLGIKLKKGEIESLKHCDTYKTKVVTKEVIPDVTAEIFWLKNRQPDKWRDKTDVDLGLSENLVETLKNVPVAELIAKADALIRKLHKS